MIKKLLAVIVIVALPYLILRARNPEPGVSGTMAASDSAGRAAVRISPNDCGAQTIAAGRVGNLRIGESVAFVKARCAVVRDTTRLGLEGMSERRLAVRFRTDSLEAEIVDDKVWRLDISTPGFRTADSLGVGTPVARLLRLREARGLVGEGVLVVVSPERCGVSFVLSGGIPRGRVRTWDSTALSALPTTITVKKVLVLACGGSDAADSSAIE